MDPRSSATSAELDEQLRLALEIFGEVHRSRRAVAEISAVKKHLAEVQQKVASKPALLKQVTDMQAAIAKIEKGSGRASPDSMGLELQTPAWRRHCAWSKAATARRRHKRSNCIISPMKQPKRHRGVDEIEKHGAGQTQSRVAEGRCAADSDFANRARGGIPDVAVGLADSRHRVL